MFGFILLTKRNATDFININLKRSFKNNTQ